MLATAFSSETRQRLAVSGNRVNQKLPILANSSTLGERFLKAFGTDDKEFIAKILGFASKQSVYKVISGERELDFERLQIFQDYTKHSIDWLLTGKGPEIFAETENPSLTLPAATYEKLRSIAHDQAAELFSDAVLGGPNQEEAALEILGQYLIGTALVEFKIIDSIADLMSEADLRRAAKLSLHPMTIDERVRLLVRETAPVSAKQGSQKVVSQIAQDDDIRAMIRDIVKEEVATSRKRPVYALNATKAGDEDEIEETTRLKKAG